MVARTERAGVVNVAVVGLGWWGCHIIERFSTLTESPIRVHLAVEKIPDKSLNFVRRHKLEIMGDYERALDRSDIDAVILPRPTASTKSRSFRRRLQASTCFVKNR